MRIKLPWQKRSTALQKFLMDINDSDSLSVEGYSRLIDCPEVQMAIERISSLVSEMTIRLYENTDKGDKRIRDELARKVDVDPWSQGTRKSWIQWIVSTMLGVGNGSAVVLPEFKNGLLQDLIPVPASKVSFREKDDTYRVIINGVEFLPDEILHFVLHPDPSQPWRGRGFKVALSDVTTNLRQAAATKNAFMSSKWKPSVIVRIDANDDGFTNPAAREKLLNEYLGSAEAGQPWLIPAELLDVTQVKPLSLADLAISDSVEADKRTIAALLGVPPYLVGVGSFNKDEHNNFVRTVVMPIATTITQTLTKGLLISPKRYFKMNPRSLYAYDLKDLASIGSDLYIRGLMYGNEARDWLGLEPLEGLDELVILENFIPKSMIGDQKKLLQNGGTTDE